MNKELTELEQKIWIILRGLNSQAKTKIIELVQKELEAARKEERKNICEKFQGLIEGDNAKCSCELLIKSICKN